MHEYYNWIYNNFYHPSYGVPCTHVHFLNDSYTHGLGIRSWLLAKDSEVRGKHPQLGRTYHRKRTLTTHQTFYGPFSGTPGWAGVRRELLDFMVQGKINRGRHTDHPDGRHYIRANQCSPPPSPIFLKAGCPSCRPAISVKTLKAKKRTLSNMKTTGKATGNHPGKYVISETVSMQPRHSSMYRQPSWPLTWSINPRHDMLKNVINLLVTEKIRDGCTKPQTRHAEQIFNSTLCSLQTFLWE